MCVSQRLTAIEAGSGAVRWRSTNAFGRSAVHDGNVASWLRDARWNQRFAVETTDEGLVREGRSVSGTLTDSPYRQSESLL